MGLTEWVRESRQRIADEGLVIGGRESLYWFGIGALGKLAFLRPGKPVYRRDWDVLVILDACRLDLLQSVADAYPYVESVGTHKSMGSTSEEWLLNNFTDEYRDEMAGTVHVTGNIYSNGTLDSDDFLCLDEVWRHSWDDERGTVLPRDITERAVHHSRVHDPERLIIHYMQPHYPFVNYPEISTGMRASGGGGNVWTRLRRGELDRDTVCEAYRDNLEYVMDELEVLLRNVDAERVVITADHGNAVGEWGIYGHPWGVPLKCIRDVPWVTTTATDEGELNPDIRHEEDATTVSEKLSALGYLE